MRRAGLAAACLPLVLGACGRQSQPPETEALPASAEAVTVAAPAGWVAPTGRERTLVPAGDHPLAGKVRLTWAVVTMPGVAQSPLQEVLANALASDRDLAHPGGRWQVVRQGEAVYGERKVAVVDALLAERGVELKVKQYCLVDRDRICVLTGEAPPELYNQAAPAFEQAAASVRFGQ